MKVFFCFLIPLPLHYSLTNSLCLELCQEAAIIQMNVMNPKLKEITDPKNANEVYLVFADGRYDDEALKKQDEQMRLVPRLLDRLIGWSTDDCFHYHSEMLTRAFKQHSSSAEGFFVLRQNFITSYSALTIAGYVCGLGDRHLDNFLVEKTVVFMLSYDLA